MHRPTINKSLIVFALFIVGLSPKLKADGQANIAEKGILDLRTSEPIGLINLNGEWAFYWGKFVFPSCSDSSKPDLYAPVPSYWIQQKKDFPNLSNFGYGTYKLKILFPKDYQDTLSLSIPIFDVAFELFVNGELIAANGKVGTSYETTIPEYKPLIQHFIIDSETMDITIHVANFHHRRGGFWKTMYLGQKERILLNDGRTRILSNALMGIIFGAFLLFLVFYLLDKNKRSFLYFSLTTFGMLIRFMNTGFFPASSLVNLQWEWIIRLEYLGTYILCIFTPLYFNTIFPRKSMNRFITVNTIFFIILSILPLFFKVHIFAWTVYIVEAVGIIVLINYTIYSFQLMLKKRKLGFLFFSTIIILFYAFINDILISSSNSISGSDYILPIAFFILIGAHSFLLITNWVSALKEKETMHAELYEINVNLENIVLKRTAELDNTNKELQASLDFKNRMFAIIAHDLKSPVSTLSQYADVLYKKFKHYDDDQLYFNLRQLSISANDLINNLLSWGMNQGHEMQYKPEKYYLHEESKNIYDIFKQQFKQKRVTLILDIPQSTLVYCDLSLLKIALRNLISNALKFTEVNGKVTVSAREENTINIITVEDTGIGMSDEKIEEILHSKTNSTAGTDGEKGTGLGFLVIKDLIELNQGCLRIESNPGRGTKISFTLPGKP